MRFSFQDSVLSVLGCLFVFAFASLGVWGAWLRFQQVDVPSSARAVALSEKNFAAAVPALWLKGMPPLPEATESQDALAADAPILVHPDLLEQKAKKFSPNDSHPHLIPASLPAQDIPDSGTTRPGRIAIIIDDMGLDRRRSARAAALPAPVTLSYLPYGTSLQEQVDSAKEKGHEIMLHMPMEPFDRTLDPGPGALTTRLQNDEFKKNIDAMLSSFKGYKGVNNHMGSRLTSDPSAMEKVMHAVKGKGVYFVDSWTSPRSVAYVAAAEADLPRARRDVFLDHYEGWQPVLDALSQAEHVARRQGYAVVIGHPKDSTLAALQNWIPAAQRRGIKIVPASELVTKVDASRDPVVAKIQASLMPAAGKKMHHTR